MASSPTAAGGGGGEKGTGGDAVTFAASPSQANKSAAATPVLHDGVRPQTSIGFARSAPDWLTSPLARAGTPGPSTPSRFLRSSVGRWNPHKGQDEVPSIFPPGAGREEWVELKGLFSKEPRLPVVKPLVTKPAKKKPPGLQTPGAGGAADEPEAHHDGDAPHRPARTHSSSQPPQKVKPPRGPLLVANADELTVATASESGEGGAGGSSGLRPHTVHSDYRKLSGLTEQANERGRRILYGRAAAARVGASSQQDTAAAKEWVPPGFEPLAVREKMWEEACGSWELSRRRYEVMISTAEPGKVLEKLGQEQSERDQQDREAKAKDQRGREEGGGGGGKQKGMFWMPGEGYVSKAPRVTSGGEKNKPKSTSELKRQAAGRIDEYRWSSERRVELAALVEQHWATRRALCGASTYSFVRENARTAKTQTRAQKLADIDRRRARNEGLMEHSLEKARRIQEERRQASLALERQMDERMALLDQRGGGEGVRPMSPGAWHPSGVLKTDMGRSPVGMN